MFQLFGHTNARVMDGGRLKWEKEKPTDCPATCPTYPQTTYKAKERDDARIARIRDEVLAHMKKHGQLVDVRSPEEYAGTQAAHARLSERRGAPRRPHPRREERARGRGRSIPTTARSRPRRS